MPSARSLLPGFALALLLTACGSSGTTSTSSTSTKDALYFPSSNLPVAYVGEVYTASLQVAGGVGPYSLRLASGKLPDGLTLSNTALSGKASAAGLFTFTVEASDASLSTKAQTVSLTVASLPPLSLTFTLPTSEIRGETRLPLVVTAPRGMRAFRLQWALPAGLTVTKIAPVDTRAVAYWKLTNSTLTLDMGFRGGVSTGDRLALVTVKPSGPVTLQTPVMSYSALGADGAVLQAQALPTPPAQPPATGTPATDTPANGLPSAAPVTAPGSAVPTQPATTPPVAPLTPQPVPTQPGTQRPGQPSLALAPAPLDRGAP
ncbi:putative Ig domain-containing protein [Deinococcus sp.]|uniref:Ig domain-containing protein n=1 Tax=Deinococcus sp. TaxID=47478 RepID=UPI003C7D30B3